MTLSVDWVVKPQHKQTKSWRNLQYDRAPSEDSDQPRHLPCQISPVWSDSSLCTQWVAKGPSFLHSDSEGSDQTGRMPRLIWVFAGRKGHFVGFVMRRLICLYKRLHKNHASHIQISVNKFSVTNSHNKDHTKIKWFAVVNWATVFKCYQAEI